MGSGPPRPWTADVEVDADRAARLITARFPHLLSSRPRIEALGTGWDNVAYEVEGRWVFRFPRREPAEQAMRSEIASLPRIAGALPVRFAAWVPRIEHVGWPQGDYRYPFAGYEKIPGRTACSVAWTDDDRARCAAPLGSFLRVLHDLVVPRDAPADPGGDKSVGELARRTRAALARVEELAGRDGLVSIALDRVRALGATPEWSGEARWVHGDLYARHVLVDGRKAPCGVIDWGDVHAGDTADDLSIAFAFLPPSAREAFFDAYGAVDAGTRDRARLYAIHSGAIIASVAPERGDASGSELGRTALAFAAASP